MTDRKPRTPHLEGYAVSYTTYLNHKCRCEGCTADHRRKHKQWRDNASPEAKKKLYKRIDDRKRRQNADQAKTVPNTRKPWTEEDRKVALNMELTSRQAANILGRTMLSVKQYRSEQRRKASGG